MFNNKLKLIIVALLACSSLAFAGDGGGTYGGVSITDATSPHNLGGKTAGDNGEVCVYCHTPHAANVAFNGAPIWNKNSAIVPTGYLMYGTTVGGSSTDATPANPSLVCLSCHDGISAVDSILNAPGSGMGSLADGTATIVGILVGGTGPYNGSWGGNIGGVLGVEGGDDGSGTGGATTADLQNDHPISITYTAGIASLRATTYVLPDGTGPAWLVPDGSGQISGLLRNGKVECVSCHDPHNAVGIAQGTAAQVNYLRHTNENSELCFGCHNK